MNKRVIIKSLLPLILILAVAALLTIAAWGPGQDLTPDCLVSYSAEDQTTPEDMLSILHQVALVPVNASLEGSFFRPEADDAQLIVSMWPEQTRTVRSIEFTFREPFKSNTEYTVYYPEGNGMFSEKCKLTGTLKAGNDSLLVELPQSASYDLSCFRLDIDDNYHLEDLRVSSSGTAGIYIPSEHRDNRLFIVLFLVHALLLGILWSLMKGKKDFLLPQRDTRLHPVATPKEVCRGNGWYLFGVLLLLALVFFEWRSCVFSRPDFVAYTTLFPGLLCLILVMGFFFRKFVLNRSEEAVIWWKVYVTLIVILSILYMAVFLPFLSPDEGTHYLSAYRIADWFLGQGTPARNARMIMRQEDYTFVSMQSIGLTLDYLKELSGQAHLFCRERGYVVHDAVLATNAILCYFPAAFGILVARILHLGGMATFYMSRGANILFCTGVMTHVLKKHHSERDPLFTLMGLPMMLQLMASCTYDTVAFCNVLLFVLQVLYLRSSQDKIPKRELLLCIFYAILLGPSKVVYLPLLFLIFLVKGELLGETRLKAVGIKLLVIASGVFSFLLVSLTLRWLSSSTALQTMITQNAGEHILSRSGEEGYTFSYIMGNLTEYILLCIRTLTRLGDEYFFTMLGSRLARYELIVPVMCGMVCFVLFLFSSNIRTEGQQCEELINREKAWCILLVSACVFCIMLALTLGWTPLSSPVIKGIQGRYFLPLLPVLIPVVRDRIILVDSSFRRRMVFLLASVNLWLLAHAFGQMYFSV